MGENDFCEVCGCHNGHSLSCAVLNLDGRNIDHRHLPGLPGPVNAKAPLPGDLLPEGPGLDDPCAAAPDLEFVAEASEITGCDWHLVTIPIAAMYGEEELSFQLDLPGEGKLEALKRWADLRAWMKDMGGPQAALDASPVIALVDDRGVIPVDGWHRCVVAARDYGQTHVRALVGAPKPEFAQEICP